MTLLFSLITITSIWCIGLTIVTQPDMLLYYVREWADKKYDNGSYWVEPVVRCFWCMPSIHSSVGFAFAFAMGIIKVFSWRLIFFYPIVACGSSLANGVVWSYVTLIMEKTSYYSKMNAPVNTTVNEPNNEGEEEQEIKEHY